MKTAWLGLGKDHKGMDEKRHPVSYFSLVFVFVVFLFVFLQNTINQSPKDVIIHKRSLVICYPVKD